MEHDIPPPRGYAKGRAKRQELIEQAIALFGDVGYRGASLREIAQRCGISHPGLLHHFPNKEALLVAVLDHRDAIDAARVHDPAASGIDGLRRLVDLVAVNVTRRGIVELFTVLSAEATSVEHPAHDHFVARYRRSIESITRTYRRALQEGTLRADVDPPTAARELVALMDGLQVQWLLDESTDMLAIVATHVEAQLA